MGAPAATSALRSAPKIAPDWDIRDPGAEAPTVSLDHATFEGQFSMTSTFRAAALASIFCLVAPCLQQLRAADEIPHGQDRQPGPALSLEDALRTMTLREGFHLELFAAEPNLVNPVTMNFDEKGRVWVAESLEYPRRDAGPGRDRIQVLEDQDGDGRADKFTIFADDLNIPAGVLVGNGGVYVTNSPDILFLKDTDGDGKADSREVLYTGFGRFDTHELPNTLSWGPDGWIYGLNGVFNPATVRHEGRETRFDAALWRFHPRTRAFELFAEGTSNPWGVAWDKDGNAFVSACVIDHLYHLAETGYYHRQAGAYPPFTWKIESVVNHAHQKAAYCSLAYYDADVYPEPFRERLYMGNIHGNCINADRLERRGATYETSAEPDFLTANDAWFMPTAVRLGPDGCLYVLDWYDRYHCYQDANRDPQGIDRLKGRLYRVAYGASPRAGKFDLARETSSQLIERLSSPNLWWRDEAKRVLSERIAAGSEAAAGESLKQLVLDPAAQRKARIHALWTLVSAADPGRAQRILDAGFLGKVLALGDSTLRAWGVRAAGNARQAPPEILARVRALAADPDADVRLNVAVAARKLFPPADALSLLFEVLSASEKDPVLPKIVWRNAEPLLDGQPAILAKWFGPRGAGLASAAFEPLLGRVVERLLASPTQGIDGVTVLAASLLEARRERPGAAESCLSSLARALSDGEIAPPGMAKLQAALSSHVAAILSEAKRSGLSGAALVVACSWHDAGAVREARTLLADASAPAEQRSRALQGLLATRDAASILEAVGGVIRGPGRASDDFLREALAGLARLESPQVATSVLEALAGLPPAVKSQAIDVLTQRPTWAGTLLDAVEAKKIDRSTLTLNQVRRLLSLRDDGVTRRVNEIWGQVRAGRSPEREKVIARMRKVLDAAAGNAWKGKAVFEKTCLKCHTIFGAGAKVGPDITANGRETLDAVLANLLDPNLVIGAGYQAWTLATKSGRALSGLLVEDSPQRVILKVEGGKDEVIPRDDVDILDRSEVSLMPEDLEKTVTEDEFRDLIAFLRYEEAPPEPIATERQAAPGGAAHALVVSRTTAS
jgi:putative heme-binding domain-containing protein